MFSPMPTLPCLSWGGGWAELAAGYRLWAGQWLQDEASPKCLHPHQCGRLGESITVAAV